jgi:hypothetical protein
LVGVFAFFIFKKIKRTLVKRRNRIMTHVSYTSVFEDNEPQLKKAERVVFETAKVLEELLPDANFSLYLNIHQPEEVLVNEARQAGYDERDNNGTSWLVHKKTISDGFYNFIEVTVFFDAPQQPVIRLPDWYLEYKNARV